MSRQAAFVEPGPLVIGKPRRQDLGLPCRGRGLKTFQLLENDLKRSCAGHPRLRRATLPGEQEREEAARGPRLDLGAQPPDGVMMDLRDNSRRSHHSSLFAFAVKHPRIAKPSTSSFASGASSSLGSDRSMQSISERAISRARGLAYGWPIDVFSKEVP